VINLKFQKNKKYILSILLLIRSMGKEKPNWISKSGEVL